MAASGHVHFIFLHCLGFIGAELAFSEFKKIVHFWARQHRRPSLCSTVPTGPRPLMPGAVFLSLVLLYLFGLLALRLAYFSKIQKCNARSCFYRYGLLTSNDRKTSISLFRAQKKRSSLLACCILPLLNVSINSVLMQELSLLCFY